MHKCLYCFNLEWKFDGWSNQSDLDNARQDRPFHRVQLWWLVCYHSAWVFWVKMHYLMWFYFWLLAYHIGAVHINALVVHFLDFVNVSILRRISQNDCHFLSRNPESALRKGAWFNNDRAFSSGGGNFLAQPLAKTSKTDFHIIWRR